MMMLNICVVFFIYAAQCLADICRQNHHFNNLNLAYNGFEHCKIFYGNITLVNLYIFPSFNPQEIHGNLTVLGGLSKKLASLYTVKDELSIFDARRLESPFPSLKEVGSLVLRKVDSTSSVFSKNIMVQKDLVLEDTHNLGQNIVSGKELNSLIVKDSIVSLDLKNLILIQTDLELFDLTEKFLNPLLPALRTVKGDVVISNFQGASLSLNIEHVEGYIFIINSPLLEKVLLPNLTHSKSLYVENKLKEITLNGKFSWEIKPFYTLEKSSQNYGSDTMSYRHDDVCDLVVDINSLNMEKFKDCRIIAGKLFIDDRTSEHFIGDLISVGSLHIQTSRPLEFHMLLFVLGSVLIENQSPRLLKFPLIQTLGNITIAGVDSIKEIIFNTYSRDSKVDSRSELLTVALNKKTQVGGIISRDMKFLQAINTGDISSLEYLILENTPALAFLGDNSYKLLVKHALVVFMTALEAIDLRSSSLNNVTINNNAHLKDIDLGFLWKVQTMLISENPALSKIDFPFLNTILISCEIDAERAQVELRYLKTWDKLTLNTADSCKHYYDYPKPSYKTRASCSGICKGNIFIGAHPTPIDFQCTSITGNLMVHKDFNHPLQTLEEITGDLAIGQSYTHGLSFPDLISIGKELKITNRNVAVDMFSRLSSVGTLLLNVVRVPGIVGLSGLKIKDSLTVKYTELSAIRDITLGPSCNVVIESNPNLKYLYLEASTLNKVVISSNSYLEAFSIKGLTAVKEDFVLARAAIQELKINIETVNQLVIKSCRNLQAINLEALRNVTGNFEIKQNYYLKYYNLENLHSVFGNFTIWGSSIKYLHLPIRNIAGTLTLANNEMTSLKLTNMTDVQSLRIHGYSSLMQINLSRLTSVQTITIDEEVPEIVLGSRLFWREGSRLRYRCAIIKSASPSKSHANPFEILKPYLFFGGYSTIPTSSECSN